ncbi:MAG: hypothetical protein IJX67_08875, partial [Oscillospiraceae bacterium]|nr:hypothetical protein [Oscillospiraceae bacterium]
ASLAFARAAFLLIPVALSDVSTSVHASMPICPAAVQELIWQNFRESYMFHCSVIKVPVFATAY